MCIGGDKFSYPSISPAITTQNGIASQNGLTPHAVVMIQEEDTALYAINISLFLVLFYLF